MPTAKAARRKPASPNKEATTPEEREKFLAEAEAHRAEAKLSRAEERQALALAKQSEISLRVKERMEADELAKDTYHHVYVFDQPVAAKSVKECINTLTGWSRLKPDGCEIEIQINSPGGDVVEGFALIDFLHDLRAKGHKVDIVALGMAASMAGVLLQAADKRIMGKNAILLIHEAQFGASGSYGDIEDRIKLIDIMHERILDLFAERAEPVNKKTTKSFIKKNWSRRDWWMNADKALQLGFIDEVR